MIPEIQRSELEPMYDMDYWDGPLTDNKALCEMCGGEIEYTGGGWRHIGVTPRHPAIPVGAVISEEKRIERIKLEANGILVGRVKAIRKLIRDELGYEASEALSFENLRLTTAQVKAVLDAIRKLEE